MIARLARTVRDELAIARDPVRHARRIGVRIGTGCRLIGTTRATFGSEPYLIAIGDHVTVAAGVRFVTHDGGVWVLRAEFPDVDVVGGIRIADNVFVGLGSILLPGTDIGANVVIGAGSVVTGPIPPDTVAAGVPARPVRTLAEYRERVLARAVHVRGRPAQEKRAAFEAHLDQR